MAPPGGMARAVDGFMDRHAAFRKTKMTRIRKMKKNAKKAISDEGKALLQAVAEKEAAEAAARAASDWRSPDYLAPLPPGMASVPGTPALHWSGAPKYALEPKKWELHLGEDAETGKRRMRIVSKARGPGAYFDSYSSFAKVTEHTRRREHAERRRRREHAFEERTLRPLKEARRTGQRPDAEHLRTASDRRARARLSKAERLAVIVRAQEVYERTHPPVAPRPHGRDRLARSPSGSAGLERGVFPRWGGTSGVTALAMSRVHGQLEAAARGRARSRSRSMRETKALERRPMDRHPWGLRPFDTTSIPGRVDDSHLADPRKSRARAAAQKRRLRRLSISHPNQEEVMRRATEAAAAAERRRQKKEEALQATAEAEAERTRARRAAPAPAPPRINLAPTDPRMSAAVPVYRFMGTSPSPLWPRGKAWDGCFVGPAGWEASARAAEAGRVAAATAAAAALAEKRKRVAAGDVDPLRHSASAPLLQRAAGSDAFVPLYAEYTPAELAECRAVFDGGARGGARLDAEGLRDCLASLGVPVTPDAARLLLAPPPSSLYDGGNDAAAYRSVDFDGFLSLVDQACRGEGPFATYGKTGLVLRRAEAAAAAAGAAPEQPQQKSSSPPRTPPEQQQQQRQQLNILRMTVSTPPPTVVRLGSREGLREMLSSPPTTWEGGMPVVTVQEDRVFEERGMAIDW